MKNILKTIFGNSLVMYISFISVMLFLVRFLPDLIVAIGTLYIYAIKGFFIVAVIVMVGHTFLGEKK